MYRKLKIIFNLFVCCILLILLMNIWLFLSPNKEQDRFSAIQNTSQTTFHIEEDIVPQFAKFPKEVHFLWCNIYENGYNRNFEFKNYLSFRSAVVFLQPEKVLFHCNQIPDRHHFYHTWFNFIMEDYAWIQIKNDTNINCSDPESKRQYLYKQLHRHPGIFVGSDTILTGLGTDFWLNESYRSTFENDMNGYIVVPGKSIYSTSIAEQENIVKTKGSLRCPVVKHLNDETLQPISPGNIRCVIFNGDLYPKNIWRKDGLMFKILNYLMYQTLETPSPVMSSTTRIPNIGHMFWIQGPINFLFYLSALSLLHIVNVDHLYLHTEGENGVIYSRGIYWEKLLKNPKVSTVIKERPDMVFGNNVRAASHMSDVFRADIMTRYGGIYSDGDVIWTQPIPDEIRKYDAVASLDWAHSNRPFPEYMNLGVSLGKKESKFWKLFLLSMKDFKDKKFGYNGLLKPYKIYERHPDSLYMHPSLQVMCFRNNCYPLSGVNYTKLNWHKDTHAFHWTFPDPVEFGNMTALLASNSIFADIGKFVLRKAGLL